MIGRLVLSSGWTVLTQETIPNTQVSSLLACKDTEHSVQLLSGFSTLVVPQYCRFLRGLVIFIKIIEFCYKKACLVGDKSLIIRIEFFEQYQQQRSFHPPKQEMGGIG